MYDSMQKEFSWPHMTNDVYQTVRNCAICARNRERSKRKWQFQLFTALRPLKSIVMDILDPLPQRKNEKVIIIVMTDRYLKMTRAIFTSKTAVTRFANVFLEHWIVPYGMPDHLPTGNGT